MSSIAGYPGNPRHPTTFFKFLIFIVLLIRFRREKCFGLLCSGSYLRGRRRDIGRKILVNKMISPKLALVGRFRGRGGKLVVAFAANSNASSRQLALKVFVTAIEVIDAQHMRFALGNQACQH